MKPYSILNLLGGLLVSQLVHAQVRIYDPKATAESSVNNRANSKVNQGINQGLDKVEEGIMGIFRKKPKKTEEAAGKPAQAGSDTPSSPTDAPVTSGPSTGKTTGTPAPTTLKAYQKFDFVPGEKVIAVEDFMQDAVGDFPDKWNSSGSGEIVTIDGHPGHWLLLNKKGEYLPEYIKSLPDNFTLQFDLASNETFSFYSSYYWVNLVAMTNPAKDFVKWGRFPSPTEGVRIGLHPRNAGSGKVGITELVTYAKGEQLLKNETDQYAFTGAGHNFVKVSMWRQKQRLRVYVNEEKVWDVPRAFQPAMSYNSVVLSMGDMHQTDDRYYLSNIRLAVGAPDTRNKLITEGKFVTHGILFDVNSDKIKPESYGAMKDIASVLTENADVRVKIIGHTDSDGDDVGNLALSKRRALAVKNALASDFGIDAGRLESDGKGESQPAGLNTTLEGKANNRRVEFIKL